MKKKLIIKNRKARYNYQIIENLEAGIVLTGSEIKSIREGKVALDSSYAGEKGGEFWLFNLHIDVGQSLDKTDFIRPRKLLLKKKRNEKNFFEAKIWWFNNYSLRFTL